MIKLNCVCCKITALLLDEKILFFSIDNIYFKIPFFLNKKPKGETSHKVTTATHQLRNAAQE